MTASGDGQILLVSHQGSEDHDTGEGHPERPARLQAVLHGAAAAGLGDRLVKVACRPASVEELQRVYQARYLETIERECRQAAHPGSHLAADRAGDTTVSAGSWDAALNAAGGGLEAVARLAAGEATAAFVAVRPPGHHATSATPMGFCLLNNVALCAAGLRAMGQRVLIVDFDAHHGNGTQDIFFSDPEVAYVSMHQWPLYPGTGRLEDVGTGKGVGTTINFPLPPGATGDVYLRALDEMVVPFAETFRPDWLIASAGFDAHRADPLADLALSAADFADITTRLMSLVPAGRRIWILEGGYDLAALADSTGACLAALAGINHRPEAATGGGPGADTVAKVVALHRNLDKCSPTLTNRSDLPR
jgi:acetoin utilization deacetylase AcuC-like enzyme